MATQTNNSKKTSNKNSKKDTSKKVTKSENSIVDEIVILLLLAFNIIILVSNFGFGGTIGNAISTFIFGVFGWVGYIFPIELFISVAFFYVNRGKPVIYIKLIASTAFIISVCAISEILSFNFDAEATILSFYTASSISRVGGGLIGGLLSKLFIPAIGTIGTLILLVILMIISIVIISEKSFLTGVTSLSTKAYGSAVKRNEHSKTRREERQEYKRQLEQENQKRRYNSVSGVSFDTTLTKASVESKTTDKLPPLFEGTNPDTFQPRTPKTNVVEPVVAPISDSFAKNATTEEVPATDAPIVKERKPRKTKETKQELEQETNAIAQDIENRNDSDGSYIFPPLDLLSKGQVTSSNGDEELRETAMKLQQTLHSFGVNVQVTDYSRGPSVTRYELQPEKGVKVSRIVGLADDIKLNLAAADIRIEAPIPGKAAVGIEVPNKENSTVALRSLLESEAFKKHESNIAFAAGKDIGGQTIVTDIGKMPHVLIAGSTGSGKSVCINTLIMSILYKANPEDVKLIMIDPKVVELSVYNGIPHLLIPVVTDPKKAAGALHWAVAEMTKRYQLFADYNVRDLKGYNEKIKTIEEIEDDTKPEKMPQIIVIVDELADLMMVAPGDVEEAICRLAQLARAAGIHLILATQRPSVNVITGLIKANMPSRIAFAVSSGVDSRTIIDMNGAEKLLGKGDMLFYPAGYPKPARVQGAFVSDQEVHKVVEFLIENQGEATYNTDVEAHVTSSASGVGSGTSSANGSNDELDAYFVDAGKFIIEKDKASIGMLQRMFKIGFNRAARIMDQLCDAGVVGEEEGTKPRKVIMSMEQFEQYIDEYI
ncbi:MAG: DNA translocase FtsK 4TM domain-containing protein [Eubacteriales bacterium]